MEMRAEGFGQIPQRTGFTPEYVMRGLSNMEWIDCKEEQTAKVADIYKDEEAFLNSQPHPKPLITKLSLPSTKEKTNRSTK